MKSDLSAIWSCYISDSSVLSVIHQRLVRVLSVLSATHLCCPWIRFWADQNCIRGQLIRVLSALYAVHSRSIRGAVVSHQWCIRDSLAFHPQISDYPPICTDDSQMYLGQNTHKIRMYHRWIADTWLTFINWRTDNGEITDDQRMDCAWITNNLRRLHG